MAKRRPARIVITNQVALNVGDGAILGGLLVVLKRAFGDEAEIIVLDRYGAIPQRYYPELIFKQAYTGRSVFVRTVRRLGLLRLHPRFVDRVARDNFEDFRSADLVVSAGGTYLVEHYPLELALLQLSMAVSSGTPTVMFTQSLGPFRKRTVRTWLCDLLPRMAAILLRDRRSLANLVDAGVPTANARIVPDAAFALANPEQVKPAAPSNARLRVAISVRSWQFPDQPASDQAARARNYREVIAALVVRLVRVHKAEVTFISTCQGVPEYMFDDSRVAREIASLLPEDAGASATIDCGFHRPEALRDILRKFDFIVATRMHAAILALCAGTPVLPIAYEFKTKELFDGLGLSEWMMDIGSLDVDHSLGLLERFILALDEIRGTMIPCVIEQKEAALSVANDLRRIVHPDSEGIA